MFCNNCGSKLPDNARFCGQCGSEIKITGPAASLPPLGPVSTNAPPFALLPREYEHASMQKMNESLRGSIMLRKAAESISRKIGKPWYESTFNSILATEKRYPRIYRLGRIAAQRLGVRQTPSLYVELDRTYQSSTYGSERDAFINIGSYLPRFLNDSELLFIIGHEIGHLACNHALWTTVSTFLVGQQRSNLMAEGVMAYLSNPLKFIESGVESLVTNWMRVADFTADRAALLAVGSFDAAKRAIFLLHLKSRKELDQMDIDEWVNQAESQDQRMSKLSQMMTSATPYLGLRLIELRKFSQSPQYESLRARVEAGCGLALAEVFDKNGNLKVLQPPTETTARIVPPPPPVQRRDTVAPPPPAQKIRMLNCNCPHCHASFAFRIVALPDKPWLDIPCRACGKKFRLNLDVIRKQALNP